MYYKENEHHAINESLFDEEHSQEFALALYQKLKQVEDVSLGVVNYKKEGQEKILKKAVVVINNTNKALLKDMYIKDCKFTVGSFSYNLHTGNLNEQKFGYQNIFLNFKSIDLQDLEKVMESFSQKHYQIAQNELKDFFNVVNEGYIYDKEGEQYTYKIIENSDPTCGGLVIIDEIRIYKEEKQIGYIMVKYTNLTIAQKIQNTPYSLLNKKTYSKKEKENYLKENQIKFDNENINLIFKEERNKIKEKLKIYYQQYETFDNIATVDYSRVAKEFQGKGLAKDMYIHIYQHLKNKNIKFRSSSLQSDSAKKLWNNFKEKSPEIIKELKIKGVDYYCMDIPENLDLLNKPKITRKLSM